jgi:hypothetical protein
MNMAEESASSEAQTSSDKDRVPRQSSELKISGSMDSIAVKVICLGDSAVGKSKYVILIRAHHKQSNQVTVIFFLYIL